MGYDYAAYKKQYDINAKNYKKSDGLSEDEFLSKMKASDKFIPVISIVIYYGEKDWDGAKSLYILRHLLEHLLNFKSFIYK